MSGISQICFFQRLRTRFSGSRMVLLTKLKEATLPAKKGPPRQNNFARFFMHSRSLEGKTNGLPLAARSAQKTEVHTNGHQSFTNFQNSQRKEARSGGISVGTGETGASLSCLKNRPRIFDESMQESKASFLSHSVRNTVISVCLEISD